MNAVSYLLMRWFCQYWDNKVMPRGGYVLMNGWAGLGVVCLSGFTQTNNMINENSNSIFIQKFFPIRRIEMSHLHFSRILRCCFKISLFKKKHVLIFPQSYIWHLKPRLDAPSTILEHSNVTDTENKLVSLGQPQNSVLKDSCLIHWHQLLRNRIGHKNCSRPETNVVKFWDTNCKCLNFNKLHVHLGSVIDTAASSFTKFQVGISLILYVIIFLAGKHANTLKNWVNHWGRFHQKYIISYNHLSRNVSALLANI